MLPVIQNKASIIDVINPDSIYRSGIDPKPNRLKTSAFENKKRNFVNLLLQLVYFCLLLYIHPLEILLSPHSQIARIWVLRMRKPVWEDSEKFTVSTIPNLPFFITLYCPKTV
jgi:hypothetical protein